MNAKYTTNPAGCAWMCEDVRGMCGDVRGCADSMLDVRLVFQVFELKHDFCGHVQQIAELDDGNMILRSFWMFSEDMTGKSNHQKVAKNSYSGAFLRKHNSF